MIARPPRTFREQRQIQLTKIAGALITFYNLAQNFES